MHPNFAKIIETLHPSLEELLKMPPCKASALSRKIPMSGVYLFTEKGIHLYVGRSNRLRSRIRRHGAINAGHNVATFAFKMARQDTGKMEASYRPEGSRENLLKDAEFAKAFDDAKARIREMEVRYVEEPDQRNQAVLEMYVAVALNTTFNDFETH